MQSHFDMIMQRHSAYLLYCGDPPHIIITFIVVQVHIYCGVALLGPLALTMQSHFDAYLLYCGHLLYRIITFIIVKVAI